MKKWLLKLVALLLCVLLPISAFVWYVEATDDA